MKKILLLTALVIASRLSAGAAVYNVRDFGAKGDGLSIDSPAINAAIENAAADGGGTVYLPTGRYASYSIRLASHIHLYLEKGAVLIAAAPKDGAGFDAPEPGPVPQYQDFGHSHWKNSLIWGIGLEDITISGGGMIDGSNLSPGYGDIDVVDGIANKALSLKECRHVVIRDITIFKGGHFCLLASGVHDLLLSGLVLDTNRDGFDIDCCRNVRISDCIVNSPLDDAIVLKSSYCLGRYQDTENVAITNCSISGFRLGSVLDCTYRRYEGLGVINPHTGQIMHHRGGGRIKLGTESSGGYKNVAITNCTIQYGGGILLECVDGGQLEDVVISNITMRECIDSPIFIRLGERMRSPEGIPVGTLRRVLISNINCWNSASWYGMQITGTPGHCVEDVTVRNVHLNFTGGCSKAEMLSPVPECEKGYPTPWMFGCRMPASDGPAIVMPSKGMFLRHVKGITFDALHFSFNNPDDRELIVAEDATDIVFRDVTLEGKEVKCPRDIKTGRK